MQSSMDTQVTEHKKHEVKIGKYEFLIQGVLTKDSNGYELKTKNGRKYTKLRIILMNEENNSSVYKAIFSEKDLKEVVLGIGNPALTQHYESNPEKFDQETLVGESGSLFLGKKNGYVNVECFIKPKLNDASLKNLSNESGASFKQELQEADNVPF